MTEQDQIVRVVSRLAEELGVQRAPSPAAHLEWDLGIGSIERHELLRRLEQELGRSLPSRQVFGAATVADLMDLTGSPEARLARVELSRSQLPAPPDQAQDLLEALRYQAAAQPERPMLFLLEEGRETARLTLPELVEAAGRVAGGLRRLGVSPGDRVGIMLPTEVGFVTTFFGVLWAGAVPVPLYPPFRPDQVEDYVVRQSAILRVAGIRHLVAFPAARAVVPLLKLEAGCLEEVVTVPELDGEPPTPQSDRLGLIQFTSGSTGQPKGVTLSHANLLANIRAYGAALELIPEDVTVSWLPLYHDMGLIGTLLGSLYHGRPLVLMAPQDFLARPSSWLRAIDAYRGTISAAPNFAYEICARKIPDQELEGLDLSCWRVALNGAEAVRAETLERFTQRFAPLGFARQALFPAYGLAEASVALTFPPPGRGPIIETISRQRLEEEGLAVPAREDAVSMVSCGRPVQGMEVRVVDGRGRVLTDRFQGQIQFRGTSAMEGYFGLGSVADEEGWLDTGDLGYLAEGELYITGRRKDLILKAGRNLHPEDIEDAVAEVPGVRRGCVAAFGVPHPEQGTEDLVIVAETRDALSEELRRAIEERVTRAVGLPPDRVVLAPPHAVPKTPSGKIRRGECRRRLLEDRLERPASPVRQVVRLLAARAKRWPRTLWCGAWLAAGLLTPQVVSLVNQRAALALLGPSSRLYLKLSGVSLEVRGSAYPGPCLVVSNHCSTIDPVVVLAAWPTPLRFLVARWVADLPVLRLLVERLGHLAVRRGAVDSVAEYKREMAKIFEVGDSLAAFPEGGFELGPGLRPFALGAFQVAAELGVPVVPVALVGTREAQPWPRVVPEAVKVTVHLGSPRTPPGSGWEQVVALARECREWIAEASGEPLVAQRLRRSD